ncbi:MAG: hypothetical protein PHT32_02075, partial [Candidatus Omnitrophica bacterium]|nr:hypothetical protein [Candidatus Omnitrophota bacterium]
RRDENISIQLADLYARLSQDIDEVTALLNKTVYPAKRTELQTMIQGMKLMRDYVRKDGGTTATGMVGCLLNAIRTISADIIAMGGTVERGMVTASFDDALASDIGFQYLFDELTRRSTGKLALFIATMNMRQLRAMNISDSAGFIDYLMQEANRPDGYTQSDVVQFLMAEALNVLPELLPTVFGAKNADTLIQYIYSTSGPGSTTDDDLEFSRLAAQIINTEKPSLYEFVQGVNAAGEMPVTRYELQGTDDVTVAYGIIISVQGTHTNWIGKAVSEFQNKLTIPGEVPYVIDNRTTATEHIDQETADHISGLDITSPSIGSINNFIQHMDAWLKPLGETGAYDRLNTLFMAQVAGSMLPDDVSVKELIKRFEAYSSGAFNTFVKTNDWNTVLGTVHSGSDLVKYLTVIAQKAGVAWKIKDVVMALMRLSVMSGAEDVFEVRLMNLFNDPSVSQSTTSEGLHNALVTLTYGDTQLAGLIDGAFDQDWLITPDDTPTTIEQKFAAYKNSLSAVIGQLHPATSEERNAILADFVQYMVDNSGASRKAARDAINTLCRGNTALLGTVSAAYSTSGTTGEFFGNLARALSSARASLAETLTQYQIYTYPLDARPISLFPAGLAVAASELDICQAMIAEVRYVDNSNAIWASPPLRQIGNLVEFSRFTQMVDTSSGAKECDVVTYHATADAGASYDDKEYLKTLSRTVLCEKGTDDVIGTVLEMNTYKNEVTKYFDAVKDIWDIPTHKVIGSFTTAQVFIPPMEAGTGGTVYNVNLLRAEAAAGASQTDIDSLSGLTIREIPGAGAGNTGLSVVGMTGMETPSDLVNYLSETAPGYTAVAAGTPQPGYNSSDVLWLISQTASRRDIKYDGLTDDQRYEQMSNYCADITSWAGPEVFAKIMKNLYDRLDPAVSSDVVAALHAKTPDNYTQYDIVQILSEFIRANKTYGDQTLYSHKKVALQEFDQDDLLAMAKAAMTKLGVTYGGVYTTLNSVEDFWGVVTLNGGTRMAAATKTLPNVVLSSCSQTVQELYADIVNRVIALRKGDYTTGCQTTSLTPPPWIATDVTRMAIASQDKKKLKELVDAIESAETGTTTEVRSAMLAALLGETKTVSDLRNDLMLIAGDPIAVFLQTVNVDTLKQSIGVDTVEEFINYILANGVSTYDNFCDLFYRVEAINTCAITAPAFFESFKHADGYIALRDYVKTINFGGLTGIDTNKEVVIYLLQHTVDGGYTAQDVLDAALLISTKLDQTSAGLTYVQKKNQLVAFLETTIDNGPVLRPIDDETLGKYLDQEKLAGLEAAHIRSAGNLSTYLSTSSAGQKYLEQYVADLTEHTIGSLFENASNTFALHYTAARDTITGMDPTKDYAANLDLLVANVTDMQLLLSQCEDAYVRVQRALNTLLSLDASDTTAYGAGTVSLVKKAIQNLYYMAALLRSGPVPVLVVNGTYTNGGSFDWSGSYTSSTSPFSSVPGGLQETAGPSTAGIPAIASIEPTAFDLESRTSGMNNNTKALFRVLDSVFVKNDRLAGDQVGQIAGRLVQGGWNSGDALTLARRIVLAIMDPQANIPQLNKDVLMQFGVFLYDDPQYGRMLFTIEKKDVVDGTPVVYLSQVSGLSNAYNGMADYITYGCVFMFMSNIEDFGRVEIRDVLTSGLIALNSRIQVFDGMENTGEQVFANMDQQKSSQKVFGYLLVSSIRGLCKNDMGAYRLARILESRLEDRPLSSSDQAWLASQEYRDVENRVVRALSNDRVKATAAHELRHFYDFKNGYQNSAANPSDEATAALASIAGSDDPRALLLTLGQIAISSPNKEYRRGYAKAVAALLLKLADKNPEILGESRKLLGNIVAALNDRAEPRFDLITAFNEFCGALNKISLTSIKAAAGDALLYVQDEIANLANGTPAATTATPAAEPAQPARSSAFAGVLPPNSTVSVMTPGPAMIDRIATLLREAENKRELLESGNELNELLDKKRDFTASYDTSIRGINELQAEAAGATSYQKARSFVLTEAKNISDLYEDTHLLYDSLLSSLAKAKRRLDSMTDTASIAQLTTFIAQLGTIKVYLETCLDTITLKSYFCQQLKQKLYAEYLKESVEENLTKIQDLHTEYDSALTTESSDVWRAFVDSQALRDDAAGYAHTLFNFAIDAYGAWTTVASASNPLLVMDQVDSDMNDLIVPFRSGSYTFGPVGSYTVGTTGADVSLGDIYIRERALEIEVDASTAGMYTPSGTGTYTPASPTLPTLGQVYSQRGLVTDPNYVQLICDGLAAQSDQANYALVQAQAIALSNPDDQEMKQQVAGVLHNARDIECVYKLFEQLTVVVKYANRVRELQTAVETTRTMLLDILNRILIESDTDKQLALAKGYEITRQQLVSAQDEISIAAQAARDAYSEAQSIEQAILSYMTYDSTNQRWTGSILTDGQFGLTTVMDSIKDLANNAVEQSELILNIDEHQTRSPTTAEQTTTETRTDYLSSRETFKQTGEEYMTHLTVTREQLILRLTEVMDNIDAWACVTGYVTTLPIGDAKAMLIKFASQSNYTELVDILKTTTTLGLTTASQFIDSVMFRLRQVGDYWFAVDAQETVQREYEMLNENLQNWVSANDPQYAALCLQAAQARTDADASKSLVTNALTYYKSRLQIMQTAQERYNLDLISLDTAADDMQRNKIKYQELASEYDVLSSSLETSKAKRDGIKKNLDSLQDALNKLMDLERLVRKQYDAVSYTQTMSAAYESDFPDYVKELPAEIRYWWTSLLDETSEIMVREYQRLAGQQMGTIADKLTVVLNEILDDGAQSRVRQLQDKINDEAKRLSEAENELSTTSNRLSQKKMEMNQVQTDVNGATEEFRTRELALAESKHLLDRRMDQFETAFDSYSRIRAEWWEKERVAYQLSARTQKDEVRQVFTDKLTQAKQDVRTKEENYIRLNLIADSDPTNIPARGMAQTAYIAYQTASAALTVAQTDLDSYLDTQTRAQLDLQNDIVLKQADYSTKLNDYTAKQAIATLPTATPTQVAAATAAFALMTAAQAAYTQAQTVYATFLAHESYLKDRQGKKDRYFAMQNTLKQVSYDVDQTRVRWNLEFTKSTTKRKIWLAAGDDQIRIIETYNASINQKTITTANEQTMEYLSQDTSDVRDEVNEQASFIEKTSYDLDKIATQVREIAANEKFASFQDQMPAEQRNYYNDVQEERVVVDARTQTLSDTLQQLSEAEQIIEEKRQQAMKVLMSLNDAGNAYAFAARVYSSTSQEAKDAQSVYNDYLKKLLELGQDMQAFYTGSYSSTVATVAGAYSTYPGSYNMILQSYLAARKSLWDVPRPDRLLSMTPIPGDTGNLYAVLPSTPVITGAPQVSACYTPTGEKVALMMKLAKYLASYNSDYLDNKTVYLAEVKAWNDVHLPVDPTASPPTSLSGIANPNGIAFPLSEEQWRQERMAERENLWGRALFYLYRYDNVQLVEDQADNAYANLVDNKAEVEAIIAQLNLDLSEATDRSDALKSKIFDLVTEIAAIDAEILDATLRRETPLSQAINSLTGTYTTAADFIAYAQGVFTAGSDIRMQFDDLISHLPDEEKTLLNTITGPDMQIRLYKRALDEEYLDVLNELRMKKDIVQKELDSVRSDLRSVSDQTRTDKKLLSGYIQPEIFAGVVPDTTVLWQALITRGYVSGGGSIMPAFNACVRPANMTLPGFSTTQRDQVFYILKQFSGLVNFAAKLQLPSGIVKQQEFQGV